MPYPPLTRSELEELIYADISDPLNAQNTARRLREVLLNLVYSCVNILDDGASAGPITLSAPANGQASATSATTLSVTASPVAHASGYKLFTSTTQTGTYTQLGGTLSSPAYTHSGLAANTPYWYEWQAVGNGSTYATSPLSAAFSGTTQASGGTYPYPAPTSVHANDSTKQVTFLRRTGSDPTLFRWDKSDNVARAMQGLMAPSATTTFVAGPQNIPAGMLRIWEVDGQGNQVSDFAICPDALTTNLPTRGNNYTGNSTFDEGGHMSNASIRQTVTDVNADSRISALINQGGVNVTQIGRGRSGWTWAQLRNDLDYQVTQAYAAMGSQPINGFSIGEAINAFYKDKWTPAQILDDGYHGWMDDVRTAPYDTVYTTASDQLLVGPTDVYQSTFDDGSAFGAFTYVDVQNYVNANLPALANSYGAQALTFDTCYYLQVGAALRGVKHNVYRNIKHPGSDTNQPLPLGTECNSLLVMASRIQAKQRYMRGQTVSDDATTFAVVVGDGTSAEVNTIALSHDSIWAWEYSADGGTSWQIWPLKYAPNGTYPVTARNEAVPSLTRTLSVTVNAPYRVETVNHARQVYAPDSDFAVNIRQAAYDALTAYLYDNSLTDHLLTACNGGTGTAGPLGMVSGDGDLFVSRWESLHGSPLVPYDPASPPKYLSASATLDCNVGNKTGLTFNADLSGSYTLLLKFENVTGSYQSLGTLLGTPYTIEADGSGANIFLYHNGTGAVAGTVAFPAGTQTIVLQQTAGANLVLSVIGQSGSAFIPALTAATGATIGNAVYNGSAIRGCKSALHGVLATTDLLTAAQLTALAPLL